MVDWEANFPETGLKDKKEKKIFKFLLALIQRDVNRLQALTKLP
jgi:hypothetical protein